MFGIVGLGAVEPRKSAIEKRVDEVNELIKEANRKGIRVIDRSSSWQAPMIYEPLKYSRKRLYVKYKKMDLYKYAQKGVITWMKRTESWGQDDIRDILNQIARMYRSAIKRGY